MSHPLEASYFMSSTNKYPAKYRRSNFHSQIGPMADFGIFYRFPGAKYRDILWSK